jgi:uncharacterized protein (DUF2384 family)
MPERRLKSSIATPASKKDPEYAGESETSVEHQPTIRRAIEVIGDPDEAMRWLGTPVPALDFATPISILHQAGGRKRVHAVLDQLEAGVW